mmetsp:Transcript_26593/g.58273  ORF Transcript_26593/g.58273 Transcript_26593/m.58273 type:complete len:124 (+) Transcript_26593:152-523(+)|eukprot:CAMPEP_0178496760 /NCGR_PEP_ID=MMETSP0696-20121128/14300_1 /TAXON_ID=265572 /ORGANISM="Extubocellulus spinifer, Strain CCMP396" /LENGTH=123 /DNA_ID=CAMNT_0020125087 /DNA_START=132 /DNA_END=503 /DNA_ORIENTATION=+
MSAPQYQQYGDQQQESGLPQPQIAANPVALDILDSVPNRIGSAILRASDGAVFHRSEGGGSPVSDHDASILYHMLRELGEVVPDDEGMKRLEISFQGGVRYTVVLVDDGLDGLVYIIKRGAND